jgi:hypothetical protein
MAKKKTTETPTEEEYEVIDVPVSEETEVVAPPKKKKKKKSQQSASTPKTASAGSQKPKAQGNAVSSEPKVKSRQKVKEIEDLGLPPHVTSWEITPNPVTGENNIITFYSGDEATTYIEITPDNLTEIMSALNDEIFIPGADVTSWYLRVPDDPELPPMFSLVAGSTIVGSLPLSDDVLKRLMPRLIKIYNPNRPSWAKFVKWVQRHKILTGVLGLPFAAVFIYSISTFII